MIIEELALAREAGIDIPDTLYSRMDTYESLNERSIQKHYRTNENLINAVCEEEKELLEIQANNPLDFADTQLKQKLHSY
jgi:hypothetical protein